MNFEELLKRIWQTQFSSCRLRIDEGSLLEKFAREERSFRRVETGIILLNCGLLVVLGCLFYQALKNPLPQPAASGPSLIWPALILALPITGLTLLMTADRFRCRRRQPRPEDSAKAFAESALAQIDHRIRLFRNVFWWFILPIICVADFGFRWYMAWWVGTVTGGTKGAASTVLGAALECAIIGTAVFFLFRWMIKRHLQPRKKEVQALLQTLQGL